MRAPRSGSFGSYACGPGRWRRRWRGTSCGSAPARPRSCATACAARSRARRECRLRAERLFRVGARELLGEEAPWQTVCAVGQDRAVVGDDERALAHADVVDRAQVGGPHGQLGQLRHEASAQLAGARGGKAVEVPGDVGAGGRHHGVELLVHGRGEAGVERGKRPVGRDGERVGGADARERGGEVVAQDAVAAGAARPHRDSSSARARRPWRACPGKAPRCRSP